MNVHLRIRYNILIQWSNYEREEFLREPWKKISSIKLMDYTPINKRKLKVVLKANYSCSY